MKIAIANFLDSHCEVLCSLRAWSHWLSQLYGHQFVETKCTSDSTTPSLPASVPTPPPDAGQLSYYNKLQSDVNIADISGVSHFWSVQIELQLMVKLSYYNKLQSHVDIAHISGVSDFWTVQIELQLMVHSFVVYSFLCV